MKRRVGWWLRKAAGPVGILTSLTRGVVAVSVTSCFEDCSNLPEVSPDECCFGGARPSGPAVAEVLSVSTVTG